MSRLNYHRPIYRTGNTLNKNKVTAPEQRRVYLTVPYQDKDEAKSLGAYWDAGIKQWYTYPSNSNLKKMKKWVHISDYARCGINYKLF